VKSRLTVEQILAWADAHHQLTGRWPTVADGTVAEAPAEHWHSLNSALRFGLRGLPGDNSLARLLNQYRRGERTLTVEQILAWAEAHRERTGCWPTAASGPVTEAPTEHWGSLQSALRQGARGLPGGDSLARLLDRHYSRTLTVPLILAWADAHRTRTGRWPTPLSGPVVEAPGLTWAAVQGALRRGRRGLPGGSSLARLLRRHRGHKRRLTLKGILAWADSHHEQTGAWPTYQSGAVADAPGEHWGAIAGALRRGLRGLPGGDTLPRLLERRRGRQRWRAERARAERPGLWTAEEDELVGTLPIQEAAERTGRTRGAVRTRRYNLGVTDKQKK
jgi:hypothetical protein